MITHLDFGTVPHVSILRYGIGHHYRLETGIIDPRDRRTRENAMRQNSIHLGGSRLHQAIGGMHNGAACVGHVIDQNGNLVLDITHQYHGGHFVGLLAFLVYQSELHIQSIGN